jgi:hypothetical protein
MKEFSDVSNKKPDLLILEFENMDKTGKGRVVQPGDKGHPKHVDNSANNANTTMSNSVWTRNANTSKNNPTEGGPTQNKPTTNPTEGGPTQNKPTTNPTEGGPTTTKPTGGNNPTEGGPIKTSGGPTEGGPGSPGGPTEGGPPGGPTEGGPPGGGKHKEINPKITVPPEPLVPLFTNPLMPVPIVPIGVTPPEPITVPPAPKENLYIPDPIVPVDQTVTKKVNNTPPIENIPPDIETGGRPRGHHGGPRYDLAAKGQESLSAPAIGVYGARVEQVGTDKNKPLKPEHPFSIAQAQVKVHNADGTTSNQESNVFVGHVTWNGTGPLYKEDKLVSDFKNKGVRDDVTVTKSDGTKTTYEYDHSEVVHNPKARIKDAKTHTDWLQRAFANGAPGTNELVLVTCTGEFDTKRHHYKDKLVVYMRDVHAKNAGVKPENVLSYFNHAGSHSEEIKVDPRAKSTGSQSVSTGNVEQVKVDKPQPVVTSSVIVDTPPTGTVTTDLKTVAKTDGTITVPPKHSYEILTNGRTTFLNDYGKNLNFQVTLDGLKPTGGEVSHTDFLKANKGTFVSNTFGLGASLNGIETSKTIANAGNGLYGFDQVWAQQKLGDKNSLNGTSIFGTATLGYSGSGLNENVGAGLKYTFKDRYSLYFGGQFDATRNGTLGSPILGGSFGLDKKNKVSLELNTNGRTSFIGLSYRP